MKKQYILPESHVVVVKLLGSVLDTGGHFGATSQETDHLSRQYENRFEDTDEAWEWE
jgi:hypothetical protein